jgi:hypothetical protein
MLSPCPPTVTVLCCSVNDFTKLSPVPDNSTGGPFGFLGIDQPPEVREVGLDLYTLLGLHGLIQGEVYLFTFNTDNIKGMPMFS